MPSPRHLLLIIAVAAGLAAAAVAATAVWDHTHPGRDSHALWVAAWNCQHKQRDCGKPKPWHEGWHRRERTYHVTFAACSALSLAAAGAFVLARRRSG